MPNSKWQSLGFHDSERLFISYLCVILREVGDRPDEHPIEVWFTNKIEAAGEPSDDLDEPHPYGPRRIRRCSLSVYTLFFAFSKRKRLLLLRARRYRRERRWIMPRGEVVERQPLLFPVGEFGPPDGPKGPTVASAGRCDDWEFQSAMAGLAWLLVRAYLASRAASMDRDTAGI